MKKNNVIIDTEKCKGCGLCVNACPKNVLSVNTDCLNTLGYLAIGVTDIDSCVGCIGCALMCPDGAISIFQLS
jgi:2-oxoglutarate ferredoxin oxidoreductase subunit delta